MIGKTGVHAIRALAQLNGLPEGQSLGAAQIAGKINAPPNYLAKLLRILARQGLVESHKGPGGGFRLARDASKIRLLDVIEPIERDGLTVGDQTVGTGSSEGCCPPTACTSATPATPCSPREPCCRSYRCSPPSSSSPR